MKNKELSEKIKKNLLDLQHNKYLQYYNTSIIILFTFLIAVIIAFITKQVDYNNTQHLVIIAGISSLIISFIMSYIIKFKEHINNIYKEIKRLNI